MARSELKFVFTGTMGAGKTQAISALSDIPVISTDVKATDEARLKKEKTTVAMDYGEIHLDDETAINLYGTPGQKRFEYMWKILADGALGVIVMVDNSREKPLEDMDVYLENFSEFSGRGAMVVAVTHADSKPRPDRAAYYNHLQKKNLGNLPVFFVDAREKTQVNLVVRSLLAMLEAYGT